MANVLITGCRGGIGLDVATRLTNKGHFVYVSVHRDESIKITKSQFSNVNENVKVLKLDISNEQDRLFAKDLDVDVLINNAAIGDSGPLADISIDRLKNTFETNIFDTLSLSQLIIKKMISKGKGRVIFIGSIAGLIPMPFLGSNLAFTHPYFTIFSCCNIVILLNS